MAKKHTSKESNDKSFYAEIKVVGANIRAAKEYANEGESQEAHRCLDNADAHLVHLQAQTQTQIAKQGREPGEDRNE